VLSAEALGDVEALHVGQHHVEDDEVRMEGRHGRQRLRPGTGRLHREALELQGHGDDIDDVRLVVDDEDTMSVGGHAHAESIGAEAGSHLRDS
jgi:hypothetical protein